MAAPRARTNLSEFIPERFCDEVYDYVDDHLAEAMDEMERQLQEAAKVGAGKGLEEQIKTTCDRVQQRLQREFDRNLDIFDRYVKKNLKAVMPDRKKSFGVRANDVDGAPKSGTSGSIAGDEDEVGAGGTASSICGAETWALDINDGDPPKRLEDERELDTELEHLRKRRRESLRRRTSLMRKGARVAAVLQDVDEFVEALQMGVSSSFDDNGLTPVPAKVQEAVESSAELRTISARAQDLSRQVGERQGRTGMASSESGKGGCAGVSPANSNPSTTSRPHDLQAVFERSREQQVIAGGVANYTALHARLRG